MKTAPIVLLLFFHSALFAQKDSSRIAIDSSGKKGSISFFVQFEGQGAYIFNQAAMVSGASLNMLINKKFYLGAKYNIASTAMRYTVYSFASTIDPTEPRSQIYYQSVTLNFGYILFATKKFSFNPELGVGWGECRKTTDSKGGPFKLNHFLAVPSVNALWNAHKNFRLGVSLGGRVAYGQNYQLLQSFHASGFYGGVFLRVGRF